MSEANRRRILEQNQLNAKRRSAKPLLDGTALTPSVLPAELLANREDDKTREGTERDQERGDR